MQYRGVLGTILTMVRTEGPRSPYNGLVAGLQRQMSFASIRIGLYDSVKQFYTPKGSERECPWGVPWTLVGGWVPGSGDQGGADSEAELRPVELVTDTQKPRQGSPRALSQRKRQASGRGTPQRTASGSGRCQAVAPWTTLSSSLQTPASPPGFWRAVPQGPWQ